MVFRADVAWPGSMRGRACEFKRRRRLARRRRPSMKEIAAMQSRILVFLAFVAVLGFVGAAQAGVTPTKGQSAEQMQKDIGECQAIATQSSGFNPSAPPPVSSAPAQAGGRVKGAAKG